MARYLGPAKVALLVMIQMYTEDGVPPDAVVPVLSFVAAQGIVKGHPFDTCTAAAPDRWQRAEATVSLLVTLKDIDELLSRFGVVSMPGRTLWDAFLARLWAVNSFDALNALFLRLPLMLQKTKEQLRREREHPEDKDDDEVEPAFRISRKSPIGSFIRRAWAEFIRMPFHLASQLWKDFVRYRQPSMQYLRRRTAIGRLAFDSVLQSAEEGREWAPEDLVNVAGAAYNEMIMSDETVPFPVTSKDMETLLEFHIDQMQKFGNRVPHEIRFQLQELLRDCSVVPSMSHYVSFLEGWRSGDYNLAFEYLHRYFDFTMHNREKIYYQYALMNLAVLQSDFGCYGEAVTTMLETISTARENRDMVCLNFALNWMFHFARAHPDVVRDLEDSSMLGTRKETMAFLRVKAKELGMSNLRSSILVTEAKMALWNGDSVATAVELLVRSSQLIVTRNMRNVISQHLALSTALWNRLGLASVASLTCEIVLRCYSRYSIFDDELRVGCSMAQALAARGKYDEALARIELAAEAAGTEALRSWKPATFWYKQRGVIRLIRELNHGDVAGAERLLTQLLQSRDDDLEPDLCAVIDELHVRVLVRRGDMQTAFAKVEDMIKRLRDDRRDVYLRVNALLLKARLYEACGRPERGFTLAMRAAGAAWEARLMPCLWAAMGAIANILIHLGEFASARALLEAVLPRSLECESAAASARLLSYLADAYMGLAGLATGQSLGRKAELLALTVATLDQALEMYAVLGDSQMQCELVAKKAVVARVEGREELATAHAATYAALVSG